MLLFLNMDVQCLYSSILRKYLTEMIKITSFDSYNLSTFTFC